jgi:hypothetical protein
VVHSRIEQANQSALDRIGETRVFWRAISLAELEIPWLRKHRLLHAGPPLVWNDMCGAMQNAALGAILYEGWANDLDQARNLAQEIKFDSAHSHQALGPMAGIISPSMPVLVLENQTFGYRAFSTINEGLGKTLRFGANSPEVISRLHWLKNTLAPMLQQALELGEPVDISSIIARAMQRGDECHNRNKSATSLLIRRLAPWLVRTSFSREQIAEALLFLDGNDHFFLNLSIAASKATLEGIVGLKDCTLVSCMAGNGVQFAIQVAALGHQWFPVTAPLAEGRYFEGYSVNDANPVMGDSYISEAAGLGGVAMAAAPAITSFVGGTTQDAVQTTLEMYAISAGEHPHYKIPTLNFRGTPLGIDIGKVVEVGITPLINTGIAHRLPGVGQIGAGIFRAPMKCFQDAVHEFQMRRPNATGSYRKEKERET